MFRLIDKRIGIIEEKPSNEPAQNDPEDAYFDEIKKKEKLVSKADLILRRD